MHVKTNYKYEFRCLIVPKVYILTLFMYICMSYVLCMYVHVHHYTRNR